MGKTCSPARPWTTSGIGSDQSVSMSRAPSRRDNVGQPPPMRLPVRHGQEHLLHPDQWTPWHQAASVSPGGEPHSKPSYNPSTRAQGPLTPSHACPGEATPIASSHRAPAAAPTLGHRPQQLDRFPFATVGRRRPSRAFRATSWRLGLPVPIPATPGRGGHQLPTRPAESGTFRLSVPAGVDRWGRLTEGRPAFLASPDPDTPVDGAGWSADTGLVMSADSREPCRRGERQGG
jgi:hypothetical protein